VIPGDELERRLARATELDHLGRTEEATQAYLSVLTLDPTHFAALNNLGTLLHDAGYRSAARTAYEEAVRYHPDNALARVNLANLLSVDGAPDAARDHYARALALAPDHVDAHRGLANLLAEAGDHAAAAQHRQAAYARQPAVSQRYRGAGPGIPLLLLIGAGGGNVPTRGLIDDRVFRVTALAPEFFEEAAPLPEHALVFNAIGDADLAGPALAAADAVLARTRAPVINRPQAVRETGRVAVARRLARVPDVIAPVVAALPRADLVAGDAAARLGLHGLGFPVLLRSPGFHTGQHFVRVEQPGTLDPALRALPGETLLAIEFLDARGADGLARKYRVMIVDGQLYPLHLAISSDWKVHYVTSAMADRPDLRDEEAAFLADMPRVIGARAMTALAAIARELALEYAGIDFAVARDGRIMPFEANATMVVNPPEPDPRWDYRRAAIAGVLDAVRAMLAARASSG
jgi:Tetratricopeptide repeat